MENFSEILSKFGIQAKDLRYEKITSGHINNTFKIYSRDSEYILQKINTNVFREPEQIMHNINIAQDSLKRSLLNSPDKLKRFPEYLKAENKNYCICNGFWRIYPYIESAELSPDVRSVYSFGRILGEFHQGTENVQVSELYVTIPDFHNIEKNIRKLTALDKPAHEQSEFYSEFLELFGSLKKSFSPIRLVHNDIKWANALINPETLLPDTLIDYDTVMPGYAAFDFGDGVRSSCITPNNEIDPDLLKAFSMGYFSQSQSISPDEAAAGILSVSAELSARYLYDVMTDSGYFAGLSNEEKLSKHRNNLKLAEFIMNNLKKTKEIISLSFDLKETPPCL